LWILVTAAVVAQEPSTDTEVSRLVAAWRRQIENRALDISRRTVILLEACQAIDRAAQASTNAPARQRHWSEAVALIDQFLQQNSDVPRARALQLQAGIYRWAQGESWRQMALLEPADPKPRAEAITALDDAIKRYRAASSAENNLTLAENLRFRLAEALADRAQLEPPAAVGRRAREDEAIKLLDPLPAEQSLSGYWHLLLADLLRRSGKPAEAEKELLEAAKAKSPPPEPELIDVRVSLLMGEKKLTEAIKEIEASRIGRAAKALWMARVHLAQRLGASEGPERFRAEADLFHWLKELKDGTSPEYRIALLELAKSQITPDPRNPPEVWDLLASAYAMAGEPAQAGAEMLRAASRAVDLGKADEAAAYRLKGGAYLFQADRFQEADVALTQVVDGSATLAAAQRARAGMLRALARGRALALQLPGASLEQYTTALDRQIRDFPQEAATDEARWLRGQLALASSDRRQVDALWTAISPGSPRWVESRLALVELDRSELERGLINPDPQKLKALAKKTDRFLAESLRQARADSDLAELSLARARLNLTPLAGDAESARQDCERLLHLALMPSLHYRARLYRMISLAELGRYVEAEREAQNHFSWRPTGDLDALFEATRLLDQCASFATTDLAQRRFGLVLRLIVEPLQSPMEKLEPEQRSELALRWTRSLLFVGADRDARRSLSSWRELPETKSDRLLRDLGDTYDRLQIYTLAIDVHRLRNKNNPAGSPAWFDARYALALAYFRTGQFDRAARLIDGTQILHPELGGGELHDRFIRLRQRLGENP
jgi:hypothetical protein